MLLCTILDWNRSPGYAVLYVVLSICLVVIGHFVLYGLYRLKMWCKGNGDEVVLVPPS